MSTAIVPPQPVMKECWERPRTRTMAVLTFLSGLVAAGRIISEWIEASAAWTELPRFIHWNMLFATLCFIGLTLFSRYTEKPRLVTRKVARMSFGIH